MTSPLLRAVETGRDTIAANNSGVSGIVDGYGRVTMRTAPQTPVCAVGEIRRRVGRTLYARWGDWFAGMCALVSAALVVRLVRARR